MSVALRTWVEVSFYADFPDDEVERDGRLDELCDAICAAITLVPHVAPGSVGIEDADTGER